MKAVNKLIRKFGIQFNNEISSEKSTPRCRFVQYQRKNDSQKHLGMVSENGTKFIQLSSDSSTSNDMISFIKQNYCMSNLNNNVLNMKAESVNDDIRLLAPITNPRKIICIGLNYKDHCTEQKAPIPKDPIFFSKFSTSVVGPVDDILAHKIARRMDYEIELAVIIGKETKKVSICDAMDYVFGYTIAQDITARDWQKRNGGQFLIGKSMDTFCPLGPAIVHKCHIPDPHNLYLKTFVNGVEKQSSSTSNMIFKIDEIIHRLSHYMTLYPGDVILTGTPSGVGAYRNPREFLKPGDLVESEIQHLGKLKNLIVNPV